jgi:hypothetical protein
MLIHFKRVRALHDWIGTVGDIKENETYKVLEERKEDGLRMLTVEFAPLETDTFDAVLFEDINNVHDKP